MLASYKESIDFDFPMTGGGSVLDTWTTYITALSGLVAAVSAFYNQIIAGRKALAEVQVEKLRLQVEQEKAKSGKKKSTKSRK